MGRGWRGYPFHRIRRGCWLGRHLGICRRTANLLVSGIIPICQSANLSAISPLLPIHSHSMLPSSSAPLPSHNHKTKSQRTWWGKAKLNLIYSAHKNQHKHSISKSQNVKREVPTLSATASAYPLRITGAFKAVGRTRRAARAKRMEFIMGGGINWRLDVDLRGVCMGSLLVVVGRLSLTIFFSLIWGHVLAWNKYIKFGLLIIYTVRGIF